MSDILLDVQGAPTTPAAGQAVIYVDSTSKKLSTKNDAGIVDTMDDITNYSVTGQGAGFATDTYLAGSSIAFLSTVPRVGTLYQMTFDVSKTGAGTATPILIVRVGTLGTVVDAARLTFTFPAPPSWMRAARPWRTPVAPTATGLTGLSVRPGPTLQVTSGAFDTTVASSIIGVSVNGGLNAAWTVQLVEAQVLNL